MGKIMLTKRQNNAASRIEWMRRAVKVNGGFFSAGFQNVGAVSAIVQRYYPKLSHEDVYKFWNFRGLDENVLAKMEIVLDNLKAE